MLRNFALVRSERDRLRRERAAFVCTRGEVNQADVDDARSEAQRDPTASVVIQPTTQDGPCWKLARVMDPETERMKFDPPIAEWCASCRRRENVTAQLRHASMKHGGALRGLLRRGTA
jgi:hypothetical protein